MNEPQNTYAELVAIKDRLYKDIARMETLLGQEKTIANIEQIMFNLRLISAGRKNELEWLDAGSWGRRSTL